VKINEENKTILREVVLLKKDKSSIIGWIGVFITVSVSSVWAYWGAIENFHEGWYSTSIWENLFMLFFQYLLFTIIFVSLAVIILRWKKIGLLLHFIVAIVSVWFFSGASFSIIGLMIAIPIIVLGLVYYYGEPKPKKWAYRLLIAVPLIIILAISIPQGIKVSQRLNDNYFGMRIVQGNGLTLVWAPRGPGWPDQGTSWDEAQRICKHLSEDGTVIMEEEQNIWRLPTVDEAVRSMMLHGQNAGGIWDSLEGKAVYERTPDKESPLWDVHSKVVYYWTSETSIHDERKAYIIVYHGGVYEKMKTNGQDYLSFRAVKEVE
jgi:hypothetical protein